MKNFIIGVITAAFCLFVAVSTGLAQTDCTSADAHLAKGKELLVQRNFKEAANEISVYVICNPDKAEGYSQRGRAYVLANNVDAALADAQKALALNPKDAIALNVRGVTAQSKKDYDAAIKDFTAAIAVEPKLVQAYLNRSNVYAERLDYEKSVADASKAIELAPNLAGAYFQRGQIFLRQKKYNEAIKDYDKFIALDAKQANVFLNRGYANEQIGDDDAAVGDYRKALTLDQKNETARKNLAALLDRFNFNSSFTSISQMEDAPPTADYYKAAQSLTELYGVMYAYNDRKFHAERILTREQFALFLNAGLNRLNEVISASNPKEILLGIGDCSAAGNKGMVICGNVDFNNLNITATEQIKDVKDSDYFRQHDSLYRALQSLTERYGIIVVDADKNFRASKQVTKKEFYKLLKNVLGYQPPDKTLLTNDAPITRGEFVIAFNEGLETGRRKVE